MAATDLLRAGVATLAVVCLTACTGTAASPTTATGESRPAPDATSLVGDWDVSGMDAEPAESTDELAELAELGFSGRVDSFSDAVLSPTAGGPEYRPVVVRITEVTVWDGSLPDSAHGDVYLTLPGARPASAYTDAIPAGTPIAAYANSLTSPASGPAHFSVKSGVPAGEDLYTVVHPDGLGIQIERDGGTYLVLPMDGAVARGKTVQALAPGETLPAR